ncbi:MAG: CSS-motif domain-containing protein, partial [Rhizobiales bacterium]|nr:CSS-motif domain-containing protein [Hyphomicrobiales bacterium]
MAALNLWLGGLADQQGRSELEQTARRQLAIAEVRIGKTVDTLNDLAARGVNSCTPNDLAALRRATFTATPIKELSVVGVDGRTLCSDVGGQSGLREVISSEPLDATRAMLLELVHIDGQPGRWLRIRRPGPRAANGLAALIPTDLFVPQV